MNGGGEAVCAGSRLAGDGQSGLARGELVGLRSRPHRPCTGGGGLIWACKGVV
jgi:hypothetical protein